MRQSEVFIPLACLAIVGGIVVALCGQLALMSEVVVVLSLAGVCIITLRLMIAKAAGSLAASRQRTGRGGSRSPRDRSVIKGRFNGPSLSDHRDESP